MVYADVANSMPYNLDKKSPLYYKGGIEEGRYVYFKI
jgi:hypothetical protein